MRVSVIGGVGFISSNIVKLLLENGYDVTVLDNLSLGYKINVDIFVQAGDIRFIETDIRDSDAVSSACERQDIVFHLAACVGRQKSLDNPVLDSETNSIGTINVLEVCTGIWCSAHRLLILCYDFQ